MVSVKVKWDNVDKTIIYVKVYNVLTWDEYHATTKMINNMVCSVSQKVDIIILSDVPLSPLPRGGATEAFRRTMQENTANIGIWVLVNAPVLLVATLQIFLVSAKCYSNRSVLFVETIEEARKILCNQSASDDHTNVVATG